MATNFLGIKKIEDNKQLVDELLQNYEDLIANASVKINFLHSHLDFSSVNLGDVNDQHGEIPEFTRTIRLDDANPPELNDFLQNVIENKQVFSWIRHAARLADLSERPSNSFRNEASEFEKPGISLKRNVRNRRPINDIHPYMYETDNLNEEPVVSVVRRKRKRRQRGYPRSRRSKGSISLDLSNEPGNGEVKVAPRSEAGVVDVPGEKYVGKHGIKRTCEDEYETHDHIRPRANNSLKSNTTTRNDNGEYYFTTPHDILGLDQDMSKEYENLNGTCIQVKKSAAIRGNAEDPRRSPPSPIGASRNFTFTTTKMVGVQQQLPNQISAQSTNQFYQRPKQFQQARAFQQPQPSQILPAQFVQQRQSLPVLDQSQVHSQLGLQARLTQNKSFAGGKGNFADQKAQDFAKLMRYVDTPSMDVQAMSKQDLLRRDNDEVLENIDRVLKSDRTGLNLFRDVPYGPGPKREEPKDTPSQNPNASPDGSKVPVKRRSTGSKFVGDENGKRMDVEVILNALPSNEFKSSENKAPPKRRKINIIGKNLKSNFEVAQSNNNDMFRKKIPIDTFPKDDQQTSDAQQQMLSDPNLKIMENADDENNDNLKLTLKEYINRQNEYNMGKRPEQQQEEEEEVTPDYQLVQEKKNLLEDQTEPTSAAEQRELGKKDPYVTPSLLNDSDSDNSLIVIPLKKNANNNNMVNINRNGEFDVGKEGFKVKESKDVIHVRTHPNSKNVVFKKETDQTGFDNSLFTKTVFKKVKEDIDKNVRVEFGDRNDNKRPSSKYENEPSDYQNVADYSNGNVIKEQNDKLEPGKESNNADYGDYENFDMKRDVSSAESQSYKFRKLNSIDYEDGIYKAKVRRKRDLEDESRANLDKRSEDDEPDEEPGNDSKEPIEHEKKIQKGSKSSKFSPKKEGGAMTLHMDQSSDIKRNDSENDYPPDDENDLGGAPSDNKARPPTVINYNYFNITVNMLSTTTPVCEDITPPNSEANQASVQTVESNNENSEQINELAHDILRYTSNAKGKSESANLKDQDKKADNLEKNADDTDKADASTNKLSEKKDGTNNNIYPKQSEDFTMKRIFMDDDEINERDVQRLTSEAKHDDDKDDEEKEREEVHAVRNAVDDAKHREMVISKLEQLVNSYKAHVQNGAISDDSTIENIDKRSSSDNNLHHYQHKKKVPQLPRPDCTARIEKHVIKSNRPQFIKPREVYYEPESMADDLKEKLLFNKVYNRVVRKRKKTPDPFMYKIIDSVFGSDEEADDDMCPVDLDDEGNDMDAPAKRTNKDEDEDSSKKSVELNERDTKIDDIIQRQKKKTKTSEEMLEKGNEIKRDEYHESPYIIKKQIMEDPRMKLDDVDSFKDVIEGSNQKGLRKREVSGKSLDDIPKSYLSPIDENGGAEKRRKRRRLKFLHKQQKKKVRQISYDDYVQQHGLGPKRLTGKQAPNKGPNFQQGQNSNVKQQEQKPKMAGNDSRGAPQALKKVDLGPNPINPSFGVPKGADYKVEEKNCTDLDNIKSNRSKMVECEVKKKEHEDMRRMLNGFLPIKLIETFYDKLKENPNLYNRFGGTITNSRQCASENEHNIKLYREEQAKVDIKHAEEMLHEVIIMLNQIVADQVHRRTCLQLAPNLRLFVIRITKNLRSTKKNYQVAEGYPLPKVKARAGEEIPLLPPEEDQGDFLFGGGGGPKKVDGRGQTDERTGIAKRIKLVERLLEKYQSMSTRCQVQVEPVKDYLLKHLNMLMKLMEDTRGATSTCATTVKDQEPLVREDELAPPRGNITIPKIVNIGGHEAVKSTSSPSASVVVDNKVKLRPDSEVLQRQQIMLLKHQQEEEKQQQLQRQIHEQELIRQMEEEQQQEDISQDTYQQQQLRERDSIVQQNLPLNNIPNNMDQVVQNDQSISNLGNRASVTPQQAALKNQQPSPTQSSMNKPAPASAGSSTTNAIVQKQLEVQGKHFSSPEIVTKDLLSLGLDGSNTYMPDFDVNRIVQEKVVKEMAATANTHTSPVPKTSGKPGPKKRAIFEQELNEDATNLEKDSQNVNDAEEGFEKPVTSRDSGRIMSKNQEMQDLMMTDLNPKSLFERKRSLNMLGFIHQPSNTSRLRYKAIPTKTPLKTPLNPPLKLSLKTPTLQKTNWDPAKVDLSNYGNNQFLWQPLLVKATEVPDPDMEDTEYYSGRKYTNPELVHNNLVSIGLDGTISSYIMPFTLSSVVQGQLNAGPKAEPKFPVEKPATVLAKPRMASDSSYYNVSEKYKRLLDTYHTLRQKRQDEERIGKLYGTKSTKTNDDIQRLNDEIHDISKVNFEKPIVFSLDG
ncbi:hypothetical protein Trydic_g22104 [Trypoxylus dichotomus]